LVVLATALLDLGFRLQRIEPSSVVRIPLAAAMFGGGTVVDTVGGSAIACRGACAAAGPGEAESKKESRTAAAWRRPR
jgi:hypothetical protein